MPVTEDYQVSIAPLADNTAELVLGPGTPYQVESMVGLSVDDIRTDDVPRALEHGLHPGLDLLGGRDVWVGVVVFGPSGTPGTPEQVTTNLDDLVGAWTAASLDYAQNDPATPTMVLRFKAPGQAVRRMVGRCRRIDRNDDTIVFGYARSRLQFVATDPRQLSDLESVSSVQAPESGATTGGMIFPATFPLTFTSSQQTELSVSNDGNMSAYPLLTVTGPITNPRIDNITDGTFIQVNLPLAPGEQLVIDTAERRVLLGGTASRAHLLAPGFTFPRLRPGVNVVRLSGTWGTGERPLLAVASRSAWL